MYPTVWVDSEFHLRRTLVTHWTIWSPVLWRHQSGITVPLEFSLIFLTNKSHMVKDQGCRQDVPELPIFSVQMLPARLSWHYCMYSIYISTRQFKESKVIIKCLHTYNIHHINVGEDLPLQGSFCSTNSSRVTQPPPTRTMTVLLR